MSTNPLNGFVYEKGAELLIDTDTNDTKIVKPRFSNCSKVVHKRISN